MATESQINANRENAQKSTGPRTAQGKAKVHLNALKHGRRAQLVVLPWEDQQDYDNLCDEWEAACKPADAAEQALVERMVANYWKAMHIESGERDIHTNCSPEKQKERIDILAKERERFDKAYDRAEAALLKRQNHRRKMQKYEAAIQPEPEPESEAEPEPESEAKPESQQPEPQEKPSPKVSPVFTAAPPKPANTRSRLTPPPLKLTF